MDDRTPTEPFSRVPPASHPARHRRSSSWDWRGFYALLILVMIAALAFLAWVLVNRSSYHSPGYSAISVNSVHTSQANRR